MSCYITLGPHTLVYLNLGLGAQSLMEPIMQCLALCIAKGLKNPEDNISWQAFYLIAWNKEPLEWFVPSKYVLISF